MEIASCGYCAGVRDTVSVFPAGTVTGSLTRTAVPLPPGGVITARTVPCWVCAVPFVTSAWTVSRLTPAELSCSTWASDSASASATCRVTGNWMPVLLSGGIWFQSTSSRVYMVFGLFG